MSGKLKTRLLSTILMFLVGICSYSVAAQEQKVTLDLKNSSLKDVLTSIEKQTEYRFSYRNSQIANVKNLTVIHSDTPVDLVLNTLLKEYNLEYAMISDRAIVITDVKKEVEQSDKTIQVKGVVKDNSGEPIIGANITLKGTSNGTISNIDGEFTLDVPADGILAVSYIGYSSQEVAINNRRNLSIILKDDTKLLDEVVVVGYGVQKKSDITGSVSSVKMSELISAPVASTAQALQGRVAGVMVQNSSGAPGSGATIRIRGANSLTYGNDPLIIVDGVQDASIGNLNPNQIESIEVLKDAAALSIYGSRGANGVILVTTKGGKNEVAQVSYNGFLSFDRVRKTLDQIDAKTYATLLNQAQADNNLAPLFTDGEIASMGQGVNWQDEIFRNTLSQTHNLSVSGSKSAISYYISGNIVLQDGIILNTDFKEYSLRANLKAQATKRLTLSLNTFGSYSKSHSGNTSAAIISALQWSPTKNVYEADGRYSQPGGGIGPVSDYNPVALAKELVDDSTIASFNISLNGEYKFADWLKLSSLLAYKSNSRMKGYFDNQVYNNGPEEDVAGSKTQSMYNSLQNTNYLTFDKDWNGHHVQATAVFELFKDQYDATIASAKGIPVEMGYQGVHFGTTIQKPWIEYSSSSMMSMMARLNYAYKNKYLFSGSFRRDGASQLAPGHKWDNFWAGSIGWNMAEERFMSSIKDVLSEFKLRASYGSVGNAAVPAYSSQMKFTPGTDANGNATLAISQLSNNNLKWERTNEVNFGLDTRLWGGRLTFNLEYYNKKTEDLLMWQQVPSALGVSSRLTNVGSVRNKGWDISLGGTPFSSNNFSWNINYSMNFNKNRILELDGINNEIISDGYAIPGLVGSFVERVGQPMGTFLGYQYAGVWKTEESSIAAMYGSKPGDAKYVDANQDGKIDSEDVVVIGNAQPKFNYGLNNSFRYKNFDLNIFFQGVYGNHIYNQNRVRREAYSGGGSFPTNPSIINYWRPDNQTGIPAFSGSEYANSSRWVEDGSYFRLKNITVGYSLPKGLMNKARISQARVYLSGNNLWTATNYKGFDPEASMGQDASGAGIDRGVYPTTKSIVIGIDLTF